MTTYRRCARCDQLIEQRPGRGRQPVYCDACRTVVDREMARLRNVANRDGNALKRIERKYGLSPERYCAMLAEQSGRCIGCHRTAADAGQTVLSIDHDHACCPGDKSCGDCVRWLVCSRCNFILGQAQDNPGLLKRLFVLLDERPQYELPMMGLA